MADALKDILNREASKKFIRLVRKSGGLRFFIKQEEKMLEQRKQQQETGTVEVDDSGLPIAKEFKEIDETSLDRNEYQINNLSKAPFEPVPLAQYKTADASSSDETDEEFDWYKPQEHDPESYFCFVNMQRRTLHPGEQAYYCYGNRSNKFLLMNYGFCFPDNRNDSYSLRLKMDIDLKELFIPKMVDFKGTEFTQEVRFKTNQFCSMLHAYLRSTCKTKFFQGQLQSQAFQRILLTKPVNLYYERYCAKYYEDLLEFLKANLEKQASLEQDLETLRSDKSDLSWASRMALTYRAEKKKIIRSQIHLIGWIKRILKEIESVS